MNHIFLRVCILLVTPVIVFFYGKYAFGSVIGDVILHEGNGVIERQANGEEQTTEIDLDVFSMDTVKTGNGKTAIEFIDQTEQIATLGLWGPKARSTLQKLMNAPDSISNEGFPYATAKEIDVQDTKIWAFRISYVGEQGWELYFPFVDGLKIWDALAKLGVTPVGIETYEDLQLDLEQALSCISQK